MTLTIVTLTWDACFSWCPLQFWASCKAHCGQEKDGSGYAVVKHSQWIFLSCSADSSYGDVVGQDNQSARHLGVENIVQEYFVSGVTGRTMMTCQHRDGACPFVSAARSPLPLSKESICLFTGFLAHYSLKLTRYQCMYLVCVTCRCQRVSSYCRLLLVREHNCRNRTNVRWAKDLWSSNDHGQANSEPERWKVWR